MDDSDYWANKPMQIDIVTLLRAGYDWLKEQLEHPEPVEVRPDTVTIGNRQYVAPMISSRPSEVMGFNLATGQIDTYKEIDGQWQLCEEG